MPSNDMGCRLMRADSSRTCITEPAVSVTSHELSNLLLSLKTRVYDKKVQPEVVSEGVSTEHDSGHKSIAPRSPTDEEPSVADNPSTSTAFIMANTHARNSDTYEALVRIGLQQYMSNYSQVSIDLPYDREERSCITIVPVPVSRHGSGSGSAGRSVHDEAISTTAKPATVTDVR